MGLIKQNVTCDICYLELFVEFAAVSVQHGQVEGPKVCIETATHRKTEEHSTLTPNPVTTTTCTVSYLTTLHIEILASLRLLEVQTPVPINFPVLIHV